MFSSLTFVGDDGISGTVELALGESRASYLAELVIAGGDVPDEWRGVVVVRDDDVPLPRGSLVEIRADGLWAELIHEADDHWSFGLEAFGLRFDTLDDARTSDVGERIPVGLDLEWDRGRVVGELLLARSRIPIDAPGTFTLTGTVTP
ncbi:MAG: hypothetical protein ABW211_00945 [Acidimicrobiia bacterium]|jgi:hypothetical protein